MDSDKLYNLLCKIYKELQTQSKCLNSFEKELQNLNKKIDDAICIKKEMLTILDESKKSF